MILPPIDSLEQIVGTYDREEKLYKTLKKIGCVNGILYKFLHDKHEGQKHLATASWSAQHSMEQDIQEYQKALKEGR